MKHEFSCVYVTGSQVIMDHPYQVPEFHYWEVFPNQRPVFEERLKWGTCCELGN